MLTDMDPVLRNCLVPGCLAQYDARASLMGEAPSRPEWSSDGWRIIRSGVVFPSGGHICPTHVEPVQNHLPTWRMVGIRLSGVICACTWDSGSHQWHGVAVALWEQHLLADVLDAFNPLRGATHAE